MEGSDGVILLEWPTPARQLGDPMKVWMSPPGPSVGTSVLGCRRVSLSADVSQETPGECYSRDATEQGEVGACHAHGKSIGASHMAGDRLDDSQGCLFERKNTGFYKWGINYLELGIGAGRLKSSYPRQIFEILSHLVTYC